MPPRLPTIATTAARSLLPSAGLQIEGGSPEAFGAGIGRGVEALGEAGQRTGSAVAYFEQRKQAEAEQAAEFDRQAQFVEFGSAEDARLSEQSRNIQGPGLDFTKGFMGSFDERSQEFLQKVPERHRDQWRAKFAALRGQLAGAALKTEFGQRDDWSKTVLSSSLTKIQNGIAQSPDSMEAYRDQGEALIDASLLSPQEKLERKAAWRANSALAYGIGRNQLDPEGNLKALGGVNPVSIHTSRVDGTPPIATRQTKPNGTLADNIVAGLKNRGLTDAQARGVAAGIASESANKPAAFNKEGGGQGAFGLGQWRGPRLAALRARYGNNPTGSQQLDFLVSELHGGDAGGKAVLGQDDEVAVLHHYVHDFMRPSAAGAKRDMARGLSALGREVVAHAEATSARLRQPEKGKSYSQEDAIQELGMTADEAKTFVDTGKMPTRAEPSDTEAAGTAAGTEAPAIDPRYADLPLSARMQLVEAAQREIEHRAQVADAQEQQDHAARVNQLLLDIDDGKAGRADIAAARKAGWLTDYDEVNKAESILDAREKTNDDLSNFQTMIHTPGFVFNQFDDNQRKAVDAGYANTVKYVSEHPDTEHTDPASIALSIWSKTGILPKQGAVMIRGALVSTDPKQVQGAASIASNMLERNPNAFAGVEGGDEIEKTALLYRHQIADLGKTPEEAAQALAVRNTPEGKRKIEANAEAAKAFRKDVQGSSVEQVLGKEFGGWIRRNDPAFTSTEQIAAVKQDYADLAAEHFEQFGDASAAKAYGLSQIKKMYGVVDGRLMKYPPTRAYPAINGSHEYIFKQAAEDIYGVTGHKIDPKDVYLVPLPTATAEAFRAGRPVPYAVHYMDEVDGQRIQQVLHGKAFIADPTIPRAAETARRKQLFEDERDTTILPGIGPIGPAEVRRQQRSIKKYQENLRAKAGTPPALGG